MIEEFGLIDFGSGCVEGLSVMDEELARRSSAGSSGQVNYRDPKKKYCCGPLPPANVPVGSIPSYGRHLYTGFPPGNPGARVCRLNKQQIRRINKYIRDNPG